MSDVGCRAPFTPSSLPTQVPAMSAFLVHPVTTSNKLTDAHSRTLFAYSILRLSLLPRAVYDISHDQPKQVGVYSAVPGPCPPIRLAGGGGIAMSIFCAVPSELSG